MIQSTAPSGMSFIFSKQSPRIIVLNGNCGKCSALQAVLRLARRIDYDDAVYKDFSGIEGQLSR
jgi:hypothetical protein